MKLFCLIISFLLLISMVFAPSRFSSPSTAVQQWFHPHRGSLGVRGGVEFRSEKRRVPTGPNPLHNKRRR
ncbi:hypothetical protein LINGRAHAP2_LOCUS18887 [Linum grandiflorum]